MLVLMILMAVGFYCERVGYLNKETSAKCSAIIVNVANPASILYSSMAEDRIPVSKLKTVLIIVLIMYTSLILFAEVIIRVLRISGLERGLYRNMTVFNNLMFMGIPIVSALYGQGAVLYIILFVLPFNVLIYTYGTIMIHSDERFSLAASLKRACNIGMLACIGSLLIYFLRIPVPELIKSPLSYLAAMISPLSMMLIGASFSRAGLGDFFADKKLFAFSVLKLFCFPLAALLILKQFISDPVLLGVCLVMFSTPAASMTAMLAEEQGVTSPTPARGVAVTTILSVATIPLLSMLVL
ncbi:MAG: AEC family transporter [Lachnospiraceae bacterium]|nr:AEC family transporter [Lachnospiraceae bacterium]